MDTSKYTSKDRSRFWAKVIVLDENSCWEWQAKKIKTGYGHFRHSGQMRRAHRIAWEMTYGEILNGLHVLHTCDNPSCVNPNHLFLGTHQDNMRDMKEKGRANYKSDGVGHNKKLTLSQVEYIRRRYAEDGITQRELAIEMGVVQTNISHIVRRENWK